MSAEMTCLKCGAKKSGDLTDVLEWDRTHRDSCPGEMNEYTPTTKEIIEHWSAVKGQAIDPAARDRHLARAAMFRRWLAAHDAEVRAGAVPEIGMPCADTKPHPAHAWQMSATGWCLCAGVVAEEPEWEYGWHTGSTVSLIGRRDQVEEWLAVRGWKLGEGDWGSRVMRRRVAGSWVPAEQEGAETDA